MSDAELQLRKENAGLRGLLSRIAAAMHLDTHPDGVERGLTEFCKNAERARRNADTQPIEVIKA